MKTDYAYIALCDTKTTDFILQLRNYIQTTYSKPKEQWPPHITVCSGNWLTDEELIATENKLGTLSNTPRFSVQTNGFSFAKKGEDNYSLRIVVRTNPELESLSQNILSIVDKSESPYKVFSLGLYHATVFGNLTEKEVSEIKKYLETITIPQEISIDSFSIFYSTFNSTERIDAYSVKKINLA
jgi:2'-5' RNA ligase